MILISLSLLELISGLRAHSGECPCALGESVAQLLWACPAMPVRELVYNHLQIFLPRLFCLAVLPGIERVVLGAGQMARWVRGLAVRAWEPEFWSQQPRKDPGEAAHMPTLLPLYTADTVGPPGLTGCQPSQPSSRFTEKSCLRSKAEDAGSGHLVWSSGLCTHRHRHTCTHVHIQQHSHKKLWYWRFQLLLLNYWILHLILLIFSSYRYIHAYNYFFPVYWSFHHYKMSFSLVILFFPLKPVSSDVDIAIPAFFCLLHGKFFAVLFLRSYLCHWIFVCLFFFFKAVTIWMC